MVDASQSVNLRSTSQNQDTVSLGPWPKGMNNRQLAYSIPPEQVADAVNGQFDLMGRFRRRAGYAKITPALGAHSGFSCDYGTFIVQNGTLSRWESDNTLTALVPGIRGPVAYLAYNGQVFWTDGTQTGRIVNGVAKRWGIVPPDFAPTAIVVAGSSSPIGQINLYATFLRADGVESGASQLIEVQAGLGDTVALSGLPVSDDPDVQSLCIYAGRGEVYYSEVVVPVGTLSASVTLRGAGIIAQPSVGLPPPPGLQLAMFRGRIFIAQGSVLWYTDLYDVEKYSPDGNYIPFPDEIDLIAAVDGKPRLRAPVTGIYVAAGNATIFLRGETVEEFLYAVVLHYGAVRHTLVPIPNTNNFMWMTPRGALMTTDDGELQNLQEASIAMSDVAGPDGAAYIREAGGNRYFIAAVSVSGANTFSREGRA